MEYLDTDNAFGFVFIFRLGNSSNHKNYVANIEYGGKCKSFLYHAYISRIPINKLSNRCNELVVALVK